MRMEKEWLHAFNPDPWKPAPAILVLVELLYVASVVLTVVPFNFHSNLNGVLLIVAESDPVPRQSGPVIEVLIGGVTLTITAALQLFPLSFTV